MITSLSEYDIYAGGKNKRSDFYGSSTSSWKPWKWMKLDLIFMMRDKSIPARTHPQKFSTSSRNTKFNDILSWSITQMITKTIPVCMRILMSYTVKRDITFWVWRRVNGNMNRFPNGGNASVEQILAGFKLMGCDSWFTTRFLIFMTKFSVMMSYFMTR